MRYGFHPLAQREFYRAIDYYENCKPGLGLEFAEEVYSAIGRILHFPKAWTSLSLNTRRCLLKRFPFGIIYSPYNVFVKEKIKKINDSIGIITPEICTPEELIEDKENQNEK